LGESLPRTDAGWRPGRVEKTSPVSIKSKPKRLWRRAASSGAKNSWETPAHALIFSSPAMAR